MAIPVFQLALRTERDVVQARQRARELAEELGLNNQDQIRMATSVSEIARNAFRYARNGKVEFAVQLEEPQSMEVTVSDSGPGIAHLDEVLEGRYRSTTGMGMGLLGSRRLMDACEVQSSPAGTIVKLAKHIPTLQAHLTPSIVRELNRKMERRLRENPYDEIEQQNQELLKTLQELRARHDELDILNHELEDTNRGVVALYAELDERADYLRRASELKTKFLSNVTHEFRTPLNSIISLARLLLDRLDGDLTSEQVKQVRYIESSARDLQDMVNDLLDLAKVEAGKIRIRPRCFEIHELFSALKGMLKPLLADNTSVELVFEDAAQLPPLHTDEGKISQILRNLISNALKFTPTGQVRIAAASAEADTILFTVEDTGIGIAAEHHQEIFREFSQVENPLQEKYRGTGLGLPLCRNLAMLLGGKIWLESEPGKGSRFYVEIPVVYVGEALKAEDTVTLAAPEFHRSPVLILEDHPETARTLESFLRETEFQAILSSTISQAEFWTSRHTPVAVVSDIYLGKDMAWEFLGSLRERLPHLPLLVTSMYEESRMAAERGIDVFLPKPVERETLVRELRRLTAQSGTRRLLIVDDNDVSRYILRELLRLPWLEIQEARNGAEALKAIDRAAPEALILDLLMPDIGGIEILEELRSDPATESLPVLIYTSKILSEAERAQLKSWNAAIIRKEEVSTRLSPRPFLDWLTAAGLSPAPSFLEPNA